METKDDAGRTPLHLAAENGREDVVQWLLQKGAILEAKAEEGRTALHYAAENGHFASMQ